MTVFSLRSPAEVLRETRADHARALRLAAWYRERHARGDAGMLERHAWAIGDARTLRARHVGLIGPRVLSG